MCYREGLDIPVAMAELALRSVNNQAVPPIKQPKVSLLHTTFISLCQTEIKYVAVCINSDFSLAT